MGKNRGKNRRLRLRWLLGALILVATIYGFRRYLPEITGYFAPKIALLNQQFNLIATPKTLKIEYFDLSAPTQNTQARYQLLALKSAQFAAIDRMKARLALLGFATSTTVKYIKQQKYHFLWVGPFETLEAAQTAQTQLKKQGIVTEINTPKVSPNQKQR